jgi:hypothetical protein
MLYLAAIIGIPAIVLAASRVKFLPVKGNFKLALISFFILYAFIVGSARLSGYQIEQELHTFDLDGDGSFREPLIKSKFSASYFIDNSQFQMGCKKTKFGSLFLFVLP